MSSRLPKLLDLSVLDSCMYTFASLVMLVRQWRRRQQAKDAYDVCIYSPCITNSQLFTITLVELLSQ